MILAKKYRKNEALDCFSGLPEGAKNVGMHTIRLFCK
jgi:hypothetical protein